MEVALSLLNKYNVPVPRYTSYPTVPFWTSDFNVEKWKETFRTQFEQHNHREGISLYIHLPFCESLCTYCGCNKKITTNHSVEGEYIDVILKEWKLYRRLMCEPPIIRELHLGGGTPTFFSPRNLQILVQAILKTAIVHPNKEFSVEAHPNNTTSFHLKTLFQLGFRRISYGVQDNDPEVQRLINRIQPFENVRLVTEQARKTGFRSVNFDLIYGLPLQTLESLEATIQQCVSLAPDRIAFYSYAHVPWTSRGQRLFNEGDLPSAPMKMRLYLLGKQLFTQAGYADIGMDHFALSHDDLYKAWIDERLHRNFMGYTTQKTSLVLGLGVSAISDAGLAFYQNDKNLRDYYRVVSDNDLAVGKGYFLTEQDVTFGRYIRDINCKGYTLFNEEDLPVLRELSFPKLKELEADGLVDWSDRELVVTSLGRNFIRNICSAFDLHLLRHQAGNGTGRFSQAI